LHLSQLFILNQIGAVCLKESISEAGGRKHGLEFGCDYFFQLAWSEARLTKTLLKNSIGARPKMKFDPEPGARL